MVFGAVALASLAAVTGAGALHRSSYGHRRSTLVLLVIVAVLAIAATAAAASIKFANCDCR